MGWGVGGGGGGVIVFVEEQVFEECLALVI